MRLRLFEIVRPLLGINKSLESRKQLEIEYDQRFKKSDGTYKFNNSYYDVEI